MTNYGQPWSTGDLATLARLRDDGLTYGECAARLGRTEQAVRRKAERVGLASPRSHWSSNQDEALRMGIADGRPHSQIAQELGRTKGAVAMRVCLLSGRLGAAR